MTLVRHGVIVSRDRRAFLDELSEWYGEDIADQVMLASLPVDERIHVLEHRNRDIAQRMRELENGD